MNNEEAIERVRERKCYCKSRIGQRCVFCRVISEIKEEFALEVGGVENG